jgi:hypothetical protein
MLMPTYQPTRCLCVVVWLRIVCPVSARFPIELHGASAYEIMPAYARARLGMPHFAIFAPPAEKSASIASMRTALVVDAVVSP